MTRRYDPGPLARRLIVALALAVGLPAVPGTAASPALFTVTDLGTLGGTYSFAWSINDRGQVAGLSSLPGDTQSCDTQSCDPFLWQHGVMTDLGTLGGPDTFAQGIDDAGIVVGYSDTGQTAGADGQFCGSYVCRAVVWQGGGIHDLGTLGGANSQAFAVNWAGQVVGQAETTAAVTSTGQPQYLPFVWRGGRIRALSSPLGGYDAGAYGINAYGVVVGFADLAGDQTADCALWWGRYFVDLGSLGGAFCGANAVNLRDQVAGSAYLPNSSLFTAVEWQRGRLSALPLLPSDNVSEGQAINDQGLIVGASAAISGTTRESLSATVWYGGRIVDLNTLIPADSGWQLQQALGINDADQIVGQGLINGQLHAFLMTPNWDVSSALAALPAPTPSNAPAAQPAPAARLAAWHAARWGRPEL